MAKEANNLDVINMLHLSDLHYDSSKPKDTEIVLNALWKDLDHFPDIDFILFTGDLVKAGDKEDDFKRAYEVFIDPLLQKTKLTRNEFFIVPGNHDMQMGAIDPITEEGLRTALIDRETLNAFLDKEIEKDFPHIERLDHFNAFKSQFHSTHTITSNKLFSTHILQKNSAKIGIACLNSSWRATGKADGYDNGKLLIGERQIYDAFQDIKDCNIKIALFHHALDWLSEYDLGDAKKMLYREFDLIFCGHLHDPNLELVQNFGNQTLLIQSGCLYKGRSYYIGYSAFQLDVQKAEGTIYLRTYFDDRHEFDRALNKCKDGQVSVKLIRKNGDDENESNSSEKKGSKMKVKIGKVGGGVIIGEEIAINTEIKNDEHRSRDTSMDVDVDTLASNAGIWEYLKVKSGGMKIDAHKIIDDELNQLEIGQILFNPPEEMRVGETERVEVRISKDLKEDLTKGLKGRGIPKIEKLKISTTMKAELSVDDFKIEPLSEKKQLIASSGYTQWEWEITPLRSGKRVICPSISVIVYLDKYGEKVKSYPVMDREIYVKVNFAYGLKKNWKWIVGTIIALIGTLIALF